MILSLDGVARSVRAEALAAVGRYEEAILTYGSLNDGFDMINGAWEGPGFLRRAQWYEELGDIDSAINFYGRFVELWADADPQLQPQVENARHRLDDLVLQSAREPQ
jgi:tetratricopeptide (TPR) repeat protein